ncbi:MAG: hypothetical protein ACX93T_01530 [Bacteroidota bacterium]
MTAMATEATDAGNGRQSKESGLGGLCCCGGSTVLDMVDDTSIKPKNTEETQMVGNNSPTSTAETPSEAHEDRLATRNKQNSHGARDTAAPQENGTPRLSAANVAHATVATILNGEQARSTTANPDRPAASTDANTSLDSGVSFDTEDAPTKTAVDEQDNDSEDKSAGSSDQVLSDKEKIKRVLIKSKVGDAAYEVTITERIVVNRLKKEKVKKPKGQQQREHHIASIQESANNNMASSNEQDDLSSADNGRQQRNMPEVLRSSDEASEAVEVELLERKKVSKAGKSNTMGSESITAQDTQAPPSDSAVVLHHTEIAPQVAKQQGSMRNNSGTTPKVVSPTLSDRSGEAAQRSVVSSAATPLKNPQNVLTPKNYEATEYDKSSVSAPPVLLQRSGKQDKAAALSAMIINKEARGSKYSDNDSMASIPSLASQSLESNGVSQSEIEEKQKLTALIGYLTILSNKSQSQSNDSDSMASIPSIASQSHGRGEAIGPARRPLEQRSMGTIHNGGMRPASSVTPNARSVASAPPILPRFRGRSNKPDTRLDNQRGPSWSPQRHVGLGANDDGSVANSSITTIDSSMYSRRSGTIVFDATPPRQRDNNQGMHNNAFSRDVHTYSSYAQYGVGTSDASTASMRRRIEALEMELGIAAPRQEENNSESDDDSQEVTSEHLSIWERYKDFFATVNNSGTSSSDSTEDSVNDGAVEDDQSYDSSHVNSQAWGGSET